MISFIKRNPYFVGACVLSVTIASVIDYMLWTAHIPMIVGWVPAAIIGYALGRIACTLDAK
jgi:uncharacterized integral membrane protein